MVNTNLGGKLELENSVIIGNDIKNKSVPTKFQLVSITKEEYEKRNQRTQIRKTQKEFIDMFNAILVSNESYFEIELKDRKLLLSLRVILRRLVRNADMINYIILSTRTIKDKYYLLIQKINDEKKEKRR
jgi:hypothetical protein